MIHKITIEAVLNGFIVKVGCQTVVFDSIGTLISTLETYLKMPDETAAAWLKAAINAKHTNTPQQNPQPMCEQAQSERHPRIGEIGGIGGRATTSTAQEDQPSDPARR